METYTGPHFTIEQFCPLPVISCLKGIIGKSGHHVTGFLPAACAEVMETQSKGLSAASNNVQRGMSNFHGSNKNAKHHN